MSSVEFPTAKSMSIVSSEAKTEEWSDLLWRMMRSHVSIRRSEWWVVCFMWVLVVGKSRAKCTDILLRVSLPANLRTPASGPFLLGRLSVSSESASVDDVKFGAVVEMLPGTEAIASESAATGVAVARGEMVVAIADMVVAVAEMLDAGAEMVVVEGEMVVAVAEIVVAVADVVDEGVLLSLTDVAMVDFPLVPVVGAVDVKGLKGPEDVGAGAAVLVVPDKVVAVGGTESLAMGLLGVLGLPNRTPPTLAAFSGVSEVSSSDAASILFRGVLAGRVAVVEWEEEVRLNLGLLVGLLVGLLIGLLLGLGVCDVSRIGARPGDLTGEGDLDESEVRIRRTDLPRDPVILTGDGEADLGDIDLERPLDEEPGIGGVGPKRFLLALRVAGVNKVGSM